MAIVTKTIGTTGRDYSTMQAWEDDLDDGGIYSTGDQAVGECYDDSDFDASLVINGGGTVGLVNVTLTVAAADRHDGTEGTGVALVASANSRQISVTVNPATIEWIEIDFNGNKSTNGQGGFYINSVVGSDTYLKNCIVHGSAGTQYSPRGITVSNDSYGNVMNCIVYDINVGISTDNYSSYGIISNARSGRGVFNCTTHNIVNNRGAAGSADCIGIRSSGTGNVMKNCLATDTTGTTGGTIADISASGPSYNATSDTSSTGTGAIISITTADQYVSTTGGSEDLHLKAGSDCIDAGTDLGTTPTGVNIDINGRDRDAEGDTWDIGAHEFVAVASSFIPRIFWYI